MSETTLGSQTGKPEVAQVRDLVGYLYKAVKTILIYPPTNPLPGEFKIHLLEKLDAYLGDRGALTLTVRGDQFVYEGETVHEESGGDDNFIATLTRDGVQKLIFVPGLNLEELDQFLGIIKRVINERCEDDDLVTLLWEASFAHIKYEAISELDSVDYAAVEQQLRARQKESIEQAASINYGSVVLEESRAADEQSAPGLGGVADGPGEISSRPLDAVDITKIIDDLADISDDLSQVDAYLREATQFDPATSTIGIIFEILIGEEDVPAFRETCSIVDNLYDRFIEQADFGSAVKIYHGVCELEETEREHSPARSQRLAESRLRTADKMRMDQFISALNNNAGCDMEACRVLLTGLPVEMLPHLVNALGELVHYSARKLVCDILAERGTDRIDTVGNGIFDKRWYVVRNVAMVLGNIGGSRACTYLQKVVKHADERVRREVIQALVRMDPTDSSSLLRAAVEDQILELRLMALRALAERRDEITGDLAAGHVVTRRFRHLEPTEQKAWLGTLARVRGDESLEVFRKLVHGFALLDRSARQRLRALTVVALGDAGGPQEIPKIVAYLERLGQNKNDRIRDASMRALNRIHSYRTGA